MIPDSILKKAVERQHRKKMQVQGGRVPLCIYRGGLVEKPPTATVGQWVACKHPDHPLKTKDDPTGEKVCSCLGCGPKCGGYTPSVPHPFAPRKITRIDSNLLGKGNTHRRTNCSILRYQGRLLLAYRVDLGGCRVWISELGEDLVPSKGVCLKLDHFRARYGQEDPRLFIHRDRLHVQYAGVEGMQGPTSVLYALLRDDLSVERICYPHWWQRPAWEKNWGMFSHEGELHAVYSIDPHVIFRVEGDSAWPAYGTGPNPLPWSGGSRRGGSAPVRVGDEYVSWFHGHRHKPGVGFYYSGGVYSFDGNPPFRPTRGIGYPVWSPDSTKRHMNASATQDVIYPSGAVLDGNRWLVSAGHQDTECLVAEFDAFEIEKLLH